MATVALLLRAVRRRPATPAMGTPALASFSAYRYYASERSSKLPSEQEQPKWSQKLGSCSTFSSQGSVRPMVQFNETYSSNLASWWKSLRFGSLFETTVCIPASDSEAESLAKKYPKCKAFGRDAYVIHRGPFSPPSMEASFLSVAILKVVIPLSGVVAIVILSLTLYAALVKASGMVLTGWSRPIGSYGSEDVHSSYSSPTVKASASHSSSSSYGGSEGVDVPVSSPTIETGGSHSSRSDGASEGVDCSGK
uniref:uncharacterized protein LOC101303657 isoform X2 n=1 Tax=Fragaria vesca subsp. vesca TaxID=101020 RepID=UPI0005CA78A5|nr:PREDICTED: uncharacterized protein LOC101303657 isoform X2 [Fragaria vesca subsp. vesca]